MMAHHHRRIFSGGRQPVMFVVRRVVWWCHTTTHSSSPAPAANKTRSYQWWLAVVLGVLRPTTPLTTHRAWLPGLTCSSDGCCDVNVVKIHENRPVEACANEIQRGGNVRRMRDWRALD